MCVCVCVCVCVCMCVRTSSLRLEAQVEDSLRTSYQPPSLKKKTRRPRKRPSQEDEVFEASGLPPASPLHAAQSSRMAARPPRSPVPGEGEWGRGLSNSSLLSVFVVPYCRVSVLCLRLLSFLLQFLLRSISPPLSHLSVPHTCQCKGVEL